MPLNKRMRIFLFLSILFVCIGCDQGTKSMAIDQLAYEAPIRYFDGFFTLMYAENSGAFLGLGDSLSPGFKYLLLIFLPTLVLFVFAATYFKQSANWFQFTGMSLIVAGGTGNLMDRIAHGSVVDFMNISIGGLRTGIFNFADVAVTVGLVALLVGVYWTKPAQKTV